jgi:hypothetical protein
MRVGAGEKFDHIFRFRIHGWTEQVGNRGRQPAGSLAALAVKGLDLGTGSPRAREKHVLAQWPKVYRAFAPRVRRALGLRKLSRKTEEKLRWAFLKLVHFLYSAVVRKIGTAEDAATARRDYLTLLRQTFGQMLLTGETREGVEFVVPLDGLLVLSAFFGVTTGSLRPCPRCWRFYTAPWMKHRQRLCDSCRQRKPHLSAHGLPHGTSLLWRRVSHRVRTRFYRNPQEREPWGRTPREAYRRWRSLALPDLRRATDLQAWEDQWARPLRRGRQRKLAGSHEDGNHDAKGCARSEPPTPGRRQRASGEGRGCAGNSDSPPRVRRGSHRARGSAWGHTPPPS